MKLVIAVVAAAAIGIGGTTAGAVALLSDAQASCAIVNPGGSFNSAYKASDSGCTIIVKAGSYPEQILTLDSTKGTAPVFFQGEDGVVVNGDLASGAPTATPNGAHNVTFRNMKATWLVTRTGSQNIRFENMRTTSINFNAGPVTLVDTDVSLGVNIIGHIKQQASGVVIERTRFHDATINDTSRHSECLMVWENATNVTIRNSIFQNCTDFGILIKSTGSNMVLENNFFDEPMPGNTITASCNPNCPRGGSSIRFSSFNYPNSVVRYNSVLGGIAIDCACVLVVSNAQNRAWFKDANPQDGTMDLHLIAGAGAIDAGVGAAPADDIDGQARSDGKPDIGADEISGSPPPPPKTQCDDAVDNDGDGKIDLLDPGCVDALDNNEADDPPLPPPPSADRTIFCDEFVVEIQLSSFHRKWIAANPSEASRWTSYRDAICVGSAPVPPSMTSHYGKAIISAGKMVLN